jgi:hypothetical protein
MNRGDQLSWEMNVGEMNIVRIKSKGKCKKPEQLSLQGFVGQPAQSDEP